MEEPEAAAAGVPVLPSFSAVAQSSASHWRRYWSDGGMIDLSAAFDVVGGNASLWRHFYIKCIILPRQARDKHRESTQKRVAFP
eukprot:COSAG06_NODE_15171_length_1092_cov_1.651561_1_plen_84_part_00